MPKISVIVPVYNAEKTLKRCVDSILAQTYTDFELLLINDGSKDASGNICDEYAAKDSRVRVFHKPNGGVSSARNIGLDNATGEWITFCDSDDWVYSSWLENYGVEQNAEYDLICQGFESDKRLGKSAPDRTIHSLEAEGTPIEILDLLFQNHIFGYLWHKIFKRKIIIDNGLRYDERIKLGEDELFLTNYSKYASSMKCVKDIGYFYHVPEWNKKYELNLDTEEILLTRMLADIRIIDIEKISVLYKYLVRANCELYDAIILSDKSRRNECFKKIRKIIKANFSVVPRNLLLRLLIYFDFTQVISKHLYILYKSYRRS